MSTLQHHPSGATLLGQTITVDGIPINAYRGIKYGTIPARFERAHLAPLEEFRGHTVDATRYGPRCPQVNVDVRHLLRIPEEYQLAEEEEDEFECLNLDVTVPANVSDETPLPVLVWIYGGSQAVTFCSAASGICGKSDLN
ncbi:hypothetical protein VTN31DRAFT_6530 [Thermomyces dupontii]|uniref:uncharacterized protein n=1 Tax=Talaromyces thermophilus TaxID=28565 RepID=UPI003744B06D